MNKIYDKIYKTDSKGKIRVWYMEQQGDNYRTWDGTLNGKIKCSEWRDAKPTNEGRSNSRDGVEQAIFEIDVHYKNKLERDYHLTIEDAQNNGAHIFEVMLAEKYKTFVPGVVDAKLDGFRCTTGADGMLSRSGKPFVSSPHIMEALAPVFEKYPDLMLDGELYNHDLHDDFSEIQSLITIKSDKKLTPENLAETRQMVQYHVYDIPSHPGVTTERKQAILDLLEEFDLSPFIHVVPSQWVDTEEEYDRLHELWISLGYEGSMWRANTTYENRRTKNLQKRKEFVDEEFEVVAMKLGQGNWKSAIKKVVCRLPDGREFGAGVKGSRKRGQELVNEEHDVVTVKYFHLTPDGIPRFGVVTKFHGKKREF